MPNHVVLVTGASSGFGLMTARALAEAGHTVYASMRDTAGRNAPRVAEAAAWAAERGADLRTVELDVQSDASAEAGLSRVLAEAGRLDALVHNAGHMVFGPAEAFTPRAIRPAVRRERARRAARQPRRPAAHARAGPGPAGVGGLLLDQWRHAALPRAVLRGQGGDGLPRGHLRRRAGALGHRDHDRGAGRTFAYSSTGFIPRPFAITAKSLPAAGISLRRDQTARPLQ